MLGENLLQLNRIMMHSVAVVGLPSSLSFHSHANGESSSRRRLFVCLIVGDDNDSLPISSENDIYLIEWHLVLLRYKVSTKMKPL